MRVGLATLVAGRPDHLRRQVRAVRQLAGIERYVVITIGEPALRCAGVVSHEVPVPTTPGHRQAGLPLARARNRAIAALADLDLAILLDVDCIPSAQLVERYVAAFARVEEAALFNGPVGYLDAFARDADWLDEAECSAARARVIRAFPDDGARRERRHELFWSLSFAVAPAVHERIGGFDERYRGWGAEDTDYSFAARQAGIALYLVAGAWAFHQPHPAPGADHAADIVANARRFHRRWGIWPMPDRLAALAAQGAIDFEPNAGLCRLAAG